MKKILSLALALALSLSLAVPAAAETASAIELTKTTGTVSVAKSNGKAVTIRANMRLYNGYNVTTGSDGYAWISLDSSKLMKLDASSSVEVRKNGSKLEVNVKSGSVSFDVSEKLGSGESLNISTSTMAVGIRGTCGWARVTDQWESEICLLEGSSQCVVADPVSGQIKSAVLTGGDVARCVVYPQEKQGDKCDILMEQQSTEGIPGFVLTELVQNVELCDKILDDSGIDVLADLAKIAGGDPSGRSADGKSASPEVLGRAERVQSREEAEAAQKLEEIRKEEESQESNVSKDPVWEQGAQPGSSGAGASGGGTAPAPTTYTVTFVYDSKTRTTQTTDTNRKLASLPDAAGSVVGDVTFQGWFTQETGGDQVTGDYVFSRNTTVYAQWDGSWMLNTDSGHLTIFNDTAMLSRAAKWYDYKAVIKTVEIRSGVTGIADEAFEDCAKLTDITIPDSVESIGNGAFISCRGLTGVTIPNSVTQILGQTFEGCSSLTEITIPDGVTYIGNSSFKGCTKLTDITIPDSVKLIMDSAFEGCTGLTSVTFAEGSNPNDIYSAAFDNCTQLKDIYFGNTRAVWEKFAYKAPDGVTVHFSRYSVTFSASGGTVNPASAVTGTDGRLTGLPTPARASNTHQSGSATVTFNYTFDGWYRYDSNTQITTDTIFDSDKTVYAHWNGEAVVSGSGAMADYGLDDNGMSTGTGTVRPWFSSNGLISNLTVQPGVTHIGSYAFHTCSSLKSVTIPESVTSIGGGAFFWCNNLTDIYFGGTRAKWNTVLKGANAIPSSATVHCSDDIEATVAFDLNGGPSTLTAPDPVKTDAAGKATMPTINYTPNTDGTLAFAGWFTEGGDKVEADTVFTSDQTVYAKWTGWDWVLDTDTQTLRIFGTGAMENFFNAAAQPWASQRGSITSVVIDNGITSVGEYAFENCTSLKSVTIPDGVTSIGKQAFYNCTGLESVTIPDGVANIYASAFTGCTGLKSVTIPVSVRRIDLAAFFNTNPEVINFGGTKAQWDAVTKGTNAIPAGVTVHCSDGDIKSNKITFDANGGTLSGASYATTNVDGTVAFPTGLTAPEKTGGNTDAKYVLDGWYTADVGGDRVEDTEVFTEDTTLYAHWKLDGWDWEKTGTDLRIYGTGNMSNYTYTNNRAPWGTDITSVEIEPGVTRIGNYAFYYCSNLTSVTIPEGVTSIGYYAFSSCSGLTSVTIPEGVTSIDIWTFFNCSSLTSVTIPEGVTSIGSTAFSICSSLTEINIPGSVTSIGESAFSSCSSLTSITIPEGVTSIGNWVFSGCSSLTSITVNEENKNYSSDGGVLLSKDKKQLLQYPMGKTDANYTVPSSVTSIKNYAFYNCGSLTSINIPEGVTSIGKGAFSGCRGLTSINIPEGVTSIGDRTFYYCSSLTSINIPEGVTSIGDDAFSGCDGLTSITIPNSVTSIGESAFSSCDGLTSITIPESVTSIGNQAFSACDGLTSITIPESVTSIGDRAFYKCSGLTDITVDPQNQNYSSENGVLLSKDKTQLIQYPIGKTDASYSVPGIVTSIGNYAFLECRGLTSVTITDSVTSIGDYAFWGCRGLTSVTIPTSVESIGNYAVSNCNGLTSVTIPNSVTSIGSSAFSSCNSLTNIEYGGTEDTWAALSENAGIKSGVTVTFSDGSSIITT